MVGTLINPQGIIVHGTQSGLARPRLEEYNSTVNYVRSGASGYGWNVTIHEDRYCKHFSTRQWGWNARYHSGSYVAAELVQAQIDDLITDGEIDLFVHWFNAEVLPVWPNIPRVFIMHSELEAGIADGKTDAAKRGQRADALRARILERLAA